MFCDDVRDTPVPETRPRRTPWRDLAAPKVAVLDLGSNSFHAVVYELGLRGEPELIDRCKIRVQLGDSVFRSGRISPAAFERGLAAMATMRELVRRHTPEAVLAVATSALREADNGRELARRASRVAGVGIRIIDGLEEARLTLLGAQRALSLGGRRFALFDVGGGSTEVLVSDRHGCALTASLPVGTLRLRGVWQPSDPPSSTDLDELSEIVSRELGPTLAHVRRLGVERLALSCGVARTLRRLGLADPLSATDQEPMAANQPLLTLSALRRLEARLGVATTGERALLTGAAPGEVDTTLIGSVILRLIHERLGVSSCLVSPGGLREGIVADYLRVRTQLTGLSLLAP